MPKTLLMSLLLGMRHTRTFVVAFTRFEIGKPTFHVAAQRRKLHGTLSCVV